MLKRLFLALVLLIVLTSAASAGITTDPGAVPSPTPCPENVVCPDDPGVNSSQSSATEAGEPSVLVFFIWGRVYVIEIP